MTEYKVLCERTLFDLMTEVNDYIKMNPGAQICGGVAVWKSLFTSYFIQAVSTGNEVTREKEPAPYFKTRTKN